MIKVYRSSDTFIITSGGHVYEAPSFSFDALFQAEDPHHHLEQVIREGTPASQDAAERAVWLAPLESQEVWAAGVTYFRSREARMEESESSGGDVFYDKVYEAERPELFFKATPARARGHGAPICVREDSSWDVPEPELTIAINCHGRVFGCTIGNDVSSRSIEGENPLYLPQAKVYRGSCAMGPALCIGGPLSPETAIELCVERDCKVVVAESTQLSQLKRSFDELAGFLFRDNDFPFGCWLMTGTGIVPSTEFSLRSGDVVSIKISGLGELKNTVA